MSVVFVVLAILVIGGAVAYAAGRWPGLTGADRDRMPDGGSSSAFDVVVRGYRMDEVDARIEALEQENAALRARRPERG